MNGLCLVMRNDAKLVVDKSLKQLSLNFLDHNLN